MESPETRQKASKEIPFVSYVSPSNPEYRQRTLELSALYVSDNMAFGTEMFPDMTHRFLDDYLEGNDPYVISEIRSLFAESLTDRAVVAHPAVQTITRGFPGDLQAPVKLLEAYKRKELPEDLFQMIIQIHGERFAGAAKRFAAEVLELRAQYTKRVREILADPSHPLTEEMLPAELFEERVNDVAVMAADPLQLFKRGVHIGGYSGGTNSITIMYDRPAVKLAGRTYHQHTYNHEMWHAVSGRSIRRISMDSLNHPPLYQAMRTGLGVDESFTWLNEAITESLSQDVAYGKRDLHYGSYETARKIYQNLIATIPEELFLKAYFENGQDGETDARPHWDNLIEHVKASFGRDVLHEIDDEIQDEDMEAGMKMLRNIL